MATLLELIQQNPNKLITVEKDGLIERFNYMFNVTVYMDSGNSYHRLDEGWSLVRPPLEDRILLTLKLIDMKTQEIIQRGFVWNNIVFSLSIPAQSNWNAIFSRNLAGKLSLPYAVTSENDEEYIIQDQTEFDGFIDQAVYAVGYQIYYGRQLKLYVKSLTTHEALDAFVDPRT